MPRPLRRLALALLIAGAPLPAGATGLSALLCEARPSRACLVELARDEVLRRSRDDSAAVAVAGVIETGRLDVALSLVPLMTPGGHRSHWDALVLGLIRDGREEAAADLARRSGFPLPSFAAEIAEGFAIRGRDEDARRALDAADPALPPLERVVALGRGHAQAGRLAAVLAVIETLPDGEARASARARISYAVADARPGTPQRTVLTALVPPDELVFRAFALTADEARAVDPNRFDDPTTRDAAAQAVARTRLRDGDWRGAIAATQPMSPFHQVMTLGEIAGESGEAEAFRALEGAVEAHGGVRAGDHDLIMASALARAGLDGAAERLLADTAVPARRDEVLRGMMLAQADRGDAATALRTERRIRDRSRHAVRLLSIARALPPA